MKQLLWEIADKLEGDSSDIFTQKNLCEVSEKENKKNTEVHPSLHQNMSKVPRQILRNYPT